jgi:hypothetical protein
MATNKIHLLVENNTINETLVPKQLRILDVDSRDLRRKLRNKAVRLKPDPRPRLCL